jgi:hypothetical protein
MRLEHYTAKYLADLNAALATCRDSAIGAYCLGVVETIVYTETGRGPTRATMMRAAACVTVKEAIDVAAYHVRNRKKARARVSA